MTEIPATGLLSAAARPAGGYLVWLVSVVLFLNAVFLLNARPAESVEILLATERERSHPYAKRLYQGALEASEALGVELLYYASDGNGEALPVKLEALLDSDASRPETRPIGIILDLPEDAARLGGVLRRLSQASVPVGSIGLHRAESEELGLLFHIGPDPFTEGRFAAAFASARNASALLCLARRTVERNICAGARAEFGEDRVTVLAFEPGTDSVAFIRQGLQTSPEIDTVLVTASGMEALPAKSHWGGRIRLQLLVDADGTTETAGRAETIDIEIDSQPELQTWLAATALVFWHQFALVPQKYIRTGSAPRRPPVPEADEQAGDARTR